MARAEHASYTRYCDVLFAATAVIHPHHAATNLDHCFVPLRDNDKQYDSGKDLCYFNFPRDKQKRKRTPSLDF